ncbi:hypothetical protein FRC08_001117 [Ceratobasidium sp. 394]|nr:hypothetical protein FRC08_001117 [Ceratobasidium sp. 394]
MRGVHDIFSRYRNRLWPPALVTHELEVILGGETCSDGSGSESGSFMAKPCAPTWDSTQKPMAPSHCRRFLHARPREM